MSEPRFFTPAEPGVWRRIAQVSATVALLAALLMALAPGTISLVTFALLTLWCHGPLSPLLPAAYEPVLLGYGRVYPPLFLAMLGAVASTGVEFANYHLYQRLLRLESVDRLLRRQETGRLTAPFYRQPFLTVWLCVLTPLPDWATRVLASHSGYSVRRYLSAVFLARLPRFWLLAALGFQLELGAGTLVWIVVASALVTLFGIARRHIVSAPSKRAIPAAAALLVGLSTMVLPGRLDAATPDSRLVCGGRDSTLSARAGENRSCLEHPAKLRDPPRPE
jgi:uncharacterized membrane protein YdjX (TVP38/TMEM64 family)